MNEAAKAMEQAIAAAQGRAHVRRACWALAAASVVLTAVFLWRAL